MTINTVIAGASTCTAPYAPTQQSFHTTVFPTVPDVNSGSTTSRPDSKRWGDWINVKDFGATGNGVTDDTAAIQAAINAIGNQVANGSFAGQPVGTVYIPAGVYKITSALTFMDNNGGKGIVIRGDGNGSNLFGNFNDYILKNTLHSGAAGPWSIENLAIQNNSTGSSGGAICTATAIGGSVRNCYIVGFIGINLSGVTPTGNTQANMSCSVYNCVLTCSGSFTAGSIGIAMSNGHGVYNCDLNAFDNGIRLWNKGQVILGGRIERCNTGIVIGQDDAGNTTGASDWLISGVSMEAVNYGVQVKAGGDGALIGINPSGSTNSPAGVGTSGMDLTSAGNITCIGCSPNGLWSVAAMVIPDGNSTNPAEQTFIGCLPNNGNTSGASGVVWSGGRGQSYVKCNQALLSQTFSNRPITPSLGDTFYCSDSTTVTFAATVAGGGGNHVKAEWNDTNWIVVGVY